MDINKSDQIVVHCDEPSEKDSLNRGKFAKAFAEIALSSETPLVVGLPE